MTERTYRVLFVCRDNAARSLMAEAILNQRGRDRFRAFSAGRHPADRPHPLALQQLRDSRLATDDLHTKSWDRFCRPDAATLDFVFMLSTAAEDTGETEPTWSGTPVVARWNIPDPGVVQGSERAVRKAFHDTFMALDWRIGLLISLPITALDQLALAEHVAGIDGN